MASYNRKDLQEKYGEKLDGISLNKKQVEDYVGEVLKNSYPVKFLIESLQKGGCSVDKRFFHVAKCDTETGGGFSTTHGVILCHNRLQTYKDVELAMAHELIHAYDYCRAADLDFTNCQHHACTEIRAANLSGDCTVLQEFLRGNMWGSAVFVGQQKRCVRRRALLSVSLNPHCQQGRAEKAVNDMMPQCFKDYEPFLQQPRTYW